MTITLTVSDTDATALQKRVEQVNKNRGTTHTVGSWLQTRLDDIVKNQVSMVESQAQQAKAVGT